MEAHLKPAVDFFRAAYYAAAAVPPTTAALWTLAVVGGLSLGTMLVPWLLTFLTFRPRDLKKRYAAEWALVTGGSSGIGLSLCRKLAAQGLNIVMVAVPNQMLTDAAVALATDFPEIQVRAIGADLGKDAATYMPALADATSDITVQLVFNNAGYIVTGFFADTPVDKWLANAYCNAMAGIAITHHFLGRMRAAGKKGCVAFTSR
jgi:short-subunit dehydrogenase